MSYSFDDEQLKESLWKAEKYYLNSLPNNEDICHQFSPNFEKRMRKLIESS
ncbi:hypothetical protein ACJDU8_09850 [Clostridium sp. WILCCON 0269]|uniref:Uncharacterized protein n=1 Tax=Candidatus Clostridium eludens TaxID=3381663 RepID=A0ABW8SKZ5_9CLOT